MDFKVSVIIPVYNCELFIEKAVRSALMQPEVCEVVVVNDGSTDASETIIKQLQAQYPKIKLYNHKNNLNKGRSATRNLGIQKATGAYIAFLDADDFYLEHRFKNDQLIFEKSQEVDGVYNAIGARFYRETNSVEIEKLKLTTVTEKINPKNLFEELLYYRKGHFSIDGLTLKKTIFNDVGYFDESLLVSEDTNLILKMALKCHLEAGIINLPVAIRGVHDYNVFNKEHIYKKYRPKVYESLLFWTNKNKIDTTQIDHLLNVLWIFKYRQTNSLLNNIAYWFFIFFKSPQLLFSKLSIKYFPLVRLRQKLFPFLYK
ncbi:glycosyltransferase family 2 protein [Mariniflexile gromovii]|uniref:Glycosyltransferase family 2 protein n=1 Tax=Mariniflexile gromovii TaxID=362523 RepID=A0ABS4BVB4_9FLAO|nr:glycosyltransferase family 2 protein [Mariniflexile gromovii]MBP0904519.1 glycosyltransferase family 2 protein [Mariniflexile gromovii]